MDAAVDDEAQRPTLRQLRANFLLWGHVGPSDEPIPPHSSRAITAQPAYRRLVSEAMAEWDAWLENPNPDDTPEEVWRRWNHWQDEQRKKGGHDDA